jgi:peptidoglycan/LPS O-acetylase OafA/YrhL
MPLPSASDLLDRDRNSFNVLRLGAAAAVIVSHAWTLRVGFGSAELGRSVSPFTVGDHAVNVFFVLSGFLIAESLSRSSSILRYAMARALRILPALIVASLASALVIGPILTTEPLADYFTEPRTWLYPLLTSFGLNSNQGLPGFLASTQFPTRVNDPIWTLKYEAAAYFGLVILAKLGAFSRPIQLVLAIVASAATLSVAAPFGDASPWVTIGHLARFSLAFLFGVAAWRWAPRLRLRWDLAVCGLVITSMPGSLPAAEPMWIFALGYAALVAGSVRFGWITDWAQRTDISYGLYIYGWPIQQVLFTWLPTWSTASLAVLSVAVTSIFARASWHWIEEPALRLKALLPAMNRTAPAR